MQEKKENKEKVVSYFSKDEQSESGYFFHRKSKFLDMVTKELRECVDITN